MSEFLCLDSYVSILFHYVQIRCYTGGPKIAITEPLEKLISSLINKIDPENFFCDDMN